MTASKDQLALVLHPLQSASRERGCPQYAKCPLYYLIWAAPNKLGLKGADYIRRQAERVKNR